LYPVEQADCTLLNGLRDKKLMRLWFLAGLCCVFVTGWLGGQDLSASGQKVIPVDLEVESSSFFTDMVVSAVVRFPEVVTAGENVPGDDSGISMLGLWKSRDRTH